MDPAEEARIKKRREEMRKTQIHAVWFSVVATILTMTFALHVVGAF